MVDQSKLAMRDVNFSWNKEELVHLCQAELSEKEGWK